MDSINKLAQLRVRKSNKSQDDLAQDYVAQTTGPYDQLRMDDPYLEEKLKFKQKYKPFYDRLKNKVDGDA